MAAFGGQEVERFDEDDVEEVSPRLECLVPRELNLPTVVFDDKGLDDRPRFQLCDVLLLRRVEETSVLQFAAGCAEEGQNRGKVVGLAPDRVGLEAGVES